jgi:transmembrane sensor
MVTPVNEIERAAAQWAAKADGDHMPADLQASFEAWLAADPRHLGAYLRVEAALARVTRLAVEGTSEPSAEVVSLEARRRNRRRFVMTGAIAASLALAVISGVVWDGAKFDRVYETQIGEKKVVALPDGSSMTLNTGTLAHVHYNLVSRDIALDRGEALFDVAKHQRRPFVVAAGDYAVRAVGTRFAVRQTVDQPFTVTVREGIVAVSGAHVAEPRMAAAGSRAVALTSGDVDVQSIGLAQLSHDLAWLDGRIVFRRQTLASAVREFERYSPIRIIIDDPAVALKTVTGTYSANDPAGFAKAVAAFMDLQVVTVGDTLHIRQKNAQHRGG